MGSRSTSDMRKESGEEEGAEEAAKAAASPASALFSTIVCDMFASPRRCSYIFCNIGNANAPVLPEPVSAAICHGEDGASSE